MAQETQVIENILNEVVLNEKNNENNEQVNNVNNENNNEVKNEGNNEATESNEPQKVYYGPLRREEVVPQDWVPDNPLFMSEFPDKDNDLLSALNSLQEDQTPEERVNTYRENGNDAFAIGNVYAYQDAIAWYTKAMEENLKDDEINSILYTNRAMVNLKLGNNL